VHGGFRPNCGADQHVLCDQNGRLPENLRLLFQSAHNSTGVAREALMSREARTAGASKAQQAAATRFWHGAAWRGPNSKEMAEVVEWQKGRAARSGWSTCVTLACCDWEAEKLKERGLIIKITTLDTATDFYGSIVTTQAYQARVDTLQRVRTGQA